MAKTKGILIGQDSDLAIKPVLNSDGLITSGLVIGVSVYQQQTLLLVLNKGELKEKPLVGVGISDYLLDDSNSDSLTQEISKQFRQDGMQIFDLDTTGGSLKVDARYDNGNGFR